MTLNERLLSVIDSNLFYLEKICQMLVNKEGIRIFFEKIMH